MTRREPAQADIAQDNFLSGLRAWVELATPEERGSRVKVMLRMIEAKQNRSAELSLDGLGLSSIPEQIGDLDALTSLNLNHNLLTTVHARIGDLAALKTLHISYNPQLNMITEEISNLAALTDLHIFHNQLITIPEGIVSLPNLKRLDLRGNNQLNPSPALIDKLSELETRGCVVKYPDQISIEVRADRARLRLQQTSRTLFLGSYDPNSKLSRLNPEIMDEVIKFTNTHPLSEEEKRLVQETAKKDVKQTKMYKKYLKNDQGAADQELANAPSSTVKVAESNSVSGYKGTNKPSER